jgi:uncharacterized protein (TIGR02452 family)
MKRRSIHAICTPIDPKMEQEMSTRPQRARIAAETLAILNAGRYRGANGREIELGDAIQAAVARTALYRPDDAAALRSKASEILRQRQHPTRIEVRNESTFSAARRLVQQAGAGRVAALNFASARNPGGGFLSGSQAQEEALARASALYPCLLSQPVYYEANRRGTSSLYTDHMIVSPNVPVFRDDHDQLIDEPWEVTIITAPAPNAAALDHKRPHLREQIEPTFRRRIENVLAAAVAFDQAALVLGAWGCGVFGNDPAMVARRFGEFLKEGGAYAHAFTDVTFAVLDRGGATLAAFADVFPSA